MLGYSTGSTKTGLDICAQSMLRQACFVPEHAGATMLISCWVLLQAVGGRLQLLYQLRIEDIEFVPLHHLQTGHVRLHQHNILCPV